jgi:glyoxylase-like metal-dependent hydrolase (beta-lactamase superfamily II)
MVGELKGRKMKNRIYQFNIGEYQGVVLYDFAYAHTAEDLIVSPNIDELEKISSEYNFTLPEISVGYNNLLLRNDERTILIDAGIQKPLGELCLGLAELDISPEDIDTIVITHTDRDHIGGITDEDGKISFPNARYIMLKEAWEHWSSEEKRNQLTKLNNWTADKTQFAWEIFSKIKGTMQFVRSGEEFGPGMKLKSAPGHRYDHSIFEYTSFSEQFVHLADAVAHPLFMANSGWYSTYDANPIQAVETKKILLNICAANNALVFASHFPFPGLGYVKQEQENWKWKPVKS